KYLFFLSILIFSACHRPVRKNKQVAATDSLTVAVVPKDTLKITPKDSVAKVVEPEEPKVNVSQVDFKYLTAKSKFSFKSKDQNIEDANVNLRIQKDSVIWLSIVAGPIEVVRGIITRDSLQLIDRYHREYYKYNFAELSQKFNFDLNFDLIQSILIGNMPIAKKSGQRFRKEKDYFLLKQEEGRISIENYIGEQNLRLKKLMLTEQPTKNSLSLDYEDFTQLNSYLFPYTSLIQLDYESKQDNLRYHTVFSIKHQKVELKDEPLTFPFSIPSRFQRK
ncbi:MAG: DUF4292 domain-containing protein, partial [Spirosomaceae bacterium]|nr:DUF4292 domain-containing protein [Spirosomataceae bacterium]